MKKLAARDFEDILQCAIPAFDGLFEDEHNETVLDLLFDLATYHAYAKMRMHTETSLTQFEEQTKVLCKTLRTFKRETCEAFITTELPREEEARIRRAKIAAAKKGLPPPNPEKQKAGPKIKKYNLETYKMHALPDVPKSIRELGTTDNSSTQAVRIFPLRCKSSIDSS